MRRLATLGLMASAIIYVSPAAAEDGIDAEVYGTLLPFFENVGTSGATPAGTITPASMVSNGLYTGIDHERRFRMTSGTSHLGFRGDLPIVEHFKLIWQVESPAPIDGEGPSNWASRNSHVGFATAWGTLIYGNWDTPMKWATTTSVNPIKGGYTADFVPIIGAPGQGLLPAFNADQTLNALLELPLNRAGFFRHEANSVQYWSPTIAGFSARLAYVANEHRTAGIPNTEPGLNPYLLSGYIGYDNPWLRLRYAYERHENYFGLSSFGGNAPSLDTPTSTDDAHLALAMVTLNGDTDHKTRVVVVGDLLSYKTDDNTIGMIDAFSRPAFYALIQQTLGSHNIWGAYGKGFEGSCNVPGGFPCTTTQMGAQYFTGGYLYSFTPVSGVFLIGYAMLNDIAGRYTPFPFLDSRLSNAPSLPPIQEISPGSDTIGVGIGFVHSFSAKIFGKDEQAPAGKH